MDIYIKLSNIIFRIRLPYPVEVQESFENFILKEIPARWDAEIEFIQGCDRFRDLQSLCLFQDEQMVFYAQDSRVLCAAKGGAAGPMSYTLCDARGSSLVCYMNTAYPPLHSLTALMQLVPLKWFLARKGSLIFHAAQIVTRSAGILFTAPSGTGKTTQSRLWAKHRGAEIVCNDRVVVRGLTTCGFPYDGADPVFNPAEHGLNAIVCLSQTPENTVTRLRPAQALAKLMNLALFDAWDPAVRDFASGALMNIVASVPVYQLNCTPDEAAVICLENQLRKDGVIQ